MKQTIIYITPGPVYGATSPLYKRRYEELSKRFSGYIFTTGSNTETFSIGEFIFSSLRYQPSRLIRIKFLAFCLLNVIKHLLNGKRIDLVCSYDPLTSGVIGYFISRLCGAKFITEVNGVYTSSAQWADVPNSIGTKMKKILYPRMIEFVLKHSDGINLLFKNQIDGFKDVTDGKIIRHFPCYVPIEHFRYIREDKEILFAGHPFKLKGVDILIAAFKQIAHKYPDWRLKILGWYPDPTLLNQAMDGHRQIYHHPPVKLYEMPGHIGTCAIFVLPSRTEAMGRVLVEAMAAGKPRVGSNIDGIPTVINDESDGLLFECGNAADLASKLDRLMSSPELRRKLGETGKIRANREFTKEVYFDNAIKFYQEVLEG